MHIRSYTVQIQEHALWIIDTDTYYKISVVIITLHTVDDIIYVLFAQLNLACRLQIAKLTYVTGPAEINHVSANYT